MVRSMRRPAVLIAVLVAVALLAVPVLAQELSPSASSTGEPSASPSDSVSPSVEPAATTLAPATSAPDSTAPLTTGPVPAASETPEASESDEAGPDGSGKPDVAGDGTPIALTGIVGTKADAEGEAEYTLTVGTVVYTLEAGPSWWWGDKHPLAPLVGKKVLIEGERDASSTEIDVLSAGGTVIRPAGKPPWAGGWKAVGPKHPGWAQWKADKWAARWPNGKPGKGPFGPQETAPTTDRER